MHQINLRSVDLNLLPVFEATYEQRSLSRAAARLAITQPAVSHALARLRLTFGEDLFVRHSRGVNPTPLADALYGRISPALALVRASLDDTQAFEPRTSQRRFVVAIPHPLGTLVALPLLQRFAREAPHVSLTFTTHSRPVDLEQGILDSRIDLSIDWLPPRRPGLGRETIAVDEIVVAARKGHPALERPRTRKWLVENAQFVTLRPRVDPREHPLEGVREWRRLDPVVALEVSEFLEVIAVVNRSNFLGIVPRSLVVASPFRDVQVVSVSPRAPRSEVQMIWRESRGGEQALAFLRAQARAAVAETLKG
jgi:DNA-binding transcriptional LysR family regulator